MKQTDQKKYGILAGMFLILLLAHVLIRADFGDDLAYQNILANQSLSSFLRERYYTWSSRVLIEAVMLLFVTGNVWLWKIADSLMVLLFLWAVSELFGGESVQEKLRAQILMFCMIWIVPFFSLSSAGWITTTINYLWPLTLGLVAMLPLRHWILEEKIPVWEYAVCPVCALYGANMEQMGAILLGGYMVFGGYLWWKRKKLPPFYFVQLLLTVGSLLFILTAPGNACRTEAETQRFFPEFATLTPWQKLWMGFLDTTQYYFAAGEGQKSYVFGLFSLVLWLAALLTFFRQGKSEEKYRKYSALGLLVSLIPVLFYWGIGQAGNFLLNSGLLTRGRNGIGVLAQNRQIPGMSYFSGGLVAFQTVCYLIVIAAVAGTVLYIWGVSEEALLQLLILAAGFLSRLVVGFSPTVYASGDRTALFCTAAILIVTLRNLQKIFASVKTK